MPQTELPPANPGGSEAKIAEGPTIIRNELQDAARHLKDQLGDAVQNLEAFRTRTMQVIHEQLSGGAEQFTDSSKALAEHVAQSGAAHATAAERLAEGAQKATSDLVAATKAIAAQMQSAGASHSKATARLTQWHIGDDNYVAARAAIVNAHHRHLMAAIWDDGTTSSSDGQYFRAGGRAGAGGSVNAQYRIDPGAVLYTHVSGHYGPFYTQVI